MSLFRRAKGAVACGAMALNSMSYGLAGDTEEFVKSLKFEIKGQVFSETTDFGTGQDRQGSRTDFHFQRLRLTISGQFNETWGFKWQSCGATGTTKQGSLGYALAA